MSDPNTYNVVFSGALTGEYPEEEAKQRFEKAFKLNPATVNHLFGSDPVVIKKHLSRELALKYAARIKSTGCQCAIEAEQLVVSEPVVKMAHSDEYSGVERRRAERRVRFRRGPRPHAITPDRRINKRRAEDRF